MNQAETLKLAAVEDGMWYFKGLHAHVLEAMKRARLATGVQILDAGCGTGGLIKRLSAQFSSVGWAGVDVNPEAVAIARQRTAGETVDCRVGSITALPWGDDCFDAVLSMDVLYHVEDDALALRELFRVLKPGGMCWLNLPAHPWLWSYHDVATSALRRYERSGLLRLLEGAGFEILNCTHWNTLLLPLIVVRRKLLPPPSGGSDVMHYPPLLDALLSSVLSLERALIRCGWRFTVGSSLWTAVRKPASPRGSSDLFGATED
jgi:SAM-dependent methyltransferase